MSKEFVTLAWDDIHRVEDGELIKGPNERSLTVNGVTYYWDFTDEHAAEFDATMARLIRCAHEDHKATKPRQGMRATAVREENGDITMLNNGAPSPLAIATTGRGRGDSAKGLAIRDRSRREHVRAWGVSKNLCKVRGIIPTDCQEAFMKEFGLEDINAPINQQALGVAANG